MNSYPCRIDGCTRPRRARGLCSAHAYRLKVHGILGGPIADQRPQGMTPEETFRWFMPGTPPESGCWEWPHTLNSHGYGRLWMSGEDTGAHVLSFIVHHGPVPKGLVVRHSCDNPPCVHPDHLLSGTVIDNIRDAMERGRNNRGAEVNTAKLTEDDVREIRRLYAETGLSQAKVGDLFGVSQVNVGQIVRRETWKHI